MPTNYGYGSASLGPINWGTLGGNWGSYQGGYQIPGAPQNAALGSPDVPQLDLTGINRQLLGGGGYDPLGTNTIPDYAKPDTGGGNSWVPDWLKGAVGTKEAPGWGGLALGAASGLASAFMGMKQYGLAKDTLAQSKEVFQKQYDANKQMTNSQLEDRQRARIASAGSGAGAYQSVGDYMAKYGIK